MYSDVFQVGRFHAEISVFSDRLINTVAAMYPVRSGVIADFNLRIEKHRWYKPQARFNFNGKYPFTPLPLSHAYPLLEWSLNWCASQHAHQFLVVHAAVIEKHGHAIILPGSPGSGKSTLSAIMHSQDNWRLLSDELALIDLHNNLVHPNPRPISLKNQSIALMQSMAPTFTFTEEVTDTIKGTVAHMKPHNDAYSHCLVPAKIKAVVFPTFAPERADNQLRPISSGQSFMRLMDNSFNYHVLRAKGFRALANAVNNSQHFEYTNNGNTEASITALNSLVSL